MSRRNAFIRINIQTCTNNQHLLSHLDQITSQEHFLIDHARINLSTVAACTIFDSPQPAFTAQLGMNTRGSRIFNRYCTRWLTPQGNRRVLRSQDNGLAGPLSVQKYQPPIQLKVLRIRHWHYKVKPSNFSRGTRDFHVERFYFSCLTNFRNFSQ